MSGPGGREPARILHALSMNVLGGVEVLFHSYLGHPASAAMAHHLLLLHGPCHPNLRATVEARARSVSSLRSWHGLPLPRPMRAWRARSVIREVRPDVILLNNAISNEALWDAALDSGAPVIYYEHGAAWMAARRSEIAARLARADVVLCNAHAARRVLELRWGLPAGRARVILNPLRADMDARAYAPKQAGTGPLRLGMAGRLVPVKGFGVGLEAVRQLADEGVACELRLAGTGEGESALRALAARLRIADRVRFLGLVRDMAAFFRETDIFLCPSVREPLGNVAVEAGFFGCPVICTAVDGLPEVVSDGETGYCVPPTLPAAGPGLPEQVYDPARDALAPPRQPAPADLAARVRRLSDDPDLFARMSRCAHERVAAAFRFDSYVHALNQMIGRAACGDRATTP